MRNECHPSTRVGMAARTAAGMAAGMAAGAGTRRERERERERESLGTYEVVTEVGRKTREGRATPTSNSNHSCKTDAPARPLHHTEDH